MTVVLSKSMVSVVLSFSPCVAIDCGQPPSALNAVQLSATGTRYGSVATFGCSEGFFWKSGENSSVCGAESVWKGPSLVCEGTIYKCFPPSKVSFRFLHSFMYLTCGWMSVLFVEKNVIMYCI